MKATKLFIVLAAAAAINLTAIGVAYGYYAINHTSVNPELAYAADNYFWGWFGGCLGFRQQPYTYQYPGNRMIQSSTYVSP